MESLAKEERDIIAQALEDYGKKLDKLMAQCIKTKQNTAAEKILGNIKLVNNLKNLIK